MLELQKYSGISTKHTCPNCGKRTFTLYVDASQNIINKSCGRCDREENCGYHYTPRDFFRDNKDVQMERTYKVISAKKEERETEYLGFDEYSKSLSMKSTLVLYLCKLFNFDKVDLACWHHFIGATRDGRTIFPYMDEKGRLRTAKIMRYEKDGHRSKTPGSIDWLHSVKKRSSELHEDFNMELCLFGLQQLTLSGDEQKTKPIAICEAEKTALICSIQYPQFIWMAAGALGWLSSEKLKPLQGRKIYLFPDAGDKAFDRWELIAKNSRGQGYDVDVSQLLKNKCTPEQWSSGIDLADIIISEITRKHDDIQ